ncbi:hypothetical protein GCM10027059_28730 [Myceligenerans halotolerans]
MTTVIFHDPPTTAIATSTGHASAARRTGSRIAGWDPASAVPVASVACALRAAGVVAGGAVLVPGAVATICSACAVVASAVMARSFRVAL